MKKRTLLLLASVLIAAVPLFVHAQDVTGGTIEDIASSVVMIDTIRGSRAISGGTGTIVSPDGTIYTNQHVIDGGEDFGIYLLDEDLGELPDLRYYASLTYVSDDLDFAILQIDRDADGRELDAVGEALPYLPPAEGIGATIGDEIRVFGFPGIGDGYMIVTSGEIVAVQNGNISGERMPVWYRTDAEISGGNSGGLAVNQNGEFLGLPTWVVSEERTAGRLGGILPIGAIQKSLESVEVDPFSLDNMRERVMNTLTITNESSTDICSAYISPTDALGWGDNHLGTDRIRSGGDYVWDFAEGTYDILLLGCDGQTLEDFRDVVVDGATVFTFMPDASTFNGEANTTAAGQIQVINNARTTICYVNISPVTSDFWGSDQLGPTEVIARADVRTFDMEPGRYDVRLRDCDRETLDEIYDVDASTDSAVITYP